MPNEPVVFSSSAEGLLRALGNKLDPRAHQRFEQLGLSLKSPLRPTCPRDVWLKASLLAGEMLFPLLSPEQQRLALGKRFISGYTETLVGKALLGLMRVLGPRRTLERLERSFQTGNNYSRAVLRDTSGGLELDIGDAPYPEWYQGMVEAALELTGAREVDVKPLRREGNSVTFSIRFK